jgi:TPR repeat protein
MGAYHATGRGIPKDLTKAVAWYERAADAGQAGAIATLAIMYARGEGVPRDPERAAELFDQAEYLGLDVSAARRLISC